MACYLLHKDIYQHVVVYEEMISNIISGTKLLFEKLDFPADYVPETLTALTKHSQNNIFGTSDMNKNELISQEDWIKADNVFQELDVPIKVNMKMDEFSKIFE